MKILHTMKVIELTSSEMKQAQKYNSPLYKEILEIRSNFPGYELVEAKKSKKSKADFCDMKFSDIEAYVKKHGSEEQKDAFASLSRCHTNKRGELVLDEPFTKIKEWFLNEFQLKKARQESREQIEKIYAAAKAKAAA